MNEGRVLGVVGAILAGIGAILLLLDAIPGNRALTVENIADIAVDLALLVIALLAAVLIATRRYGAGGLLGILGGVATIVVPGGSFTAGILLILGGALGIVASAMRS